MPTLPRPDAVLSGALAAHLEAQLAGVSETGWVGGGVAHGGCGCERAAGAQEISRARLGEIAVLWAMVGASASSARSDLLGRGERAEQRLSQLGALEMCERGALDPEWGGVVVAAEQQALCGALSPGVLVEASASELREWLEVVTACGNEVTNQALRAALAGEEGGIREWQERRHVLEERFGDALCSVRDDHSQADEGVGRTHARLRRHREVYELLGGVVAEEGRALVHHGAPGFVDHWEQVLARSCGVVLARSGVRSVRLVALGLSGWRGDEISWGEVPPEVSSRGLEIAARLICEDETLEVAEAIALGELCVLG